MVLHCTPASKQTAVESVREGNQGQTTEQRPVEIGQRDFLACQRICRTVSLDQGSLLHWQHKLTFSDVSHTAEDDAARQEQDQHEWDQACDAQRSNAAQWREGQYNQHSRD